MLGHRQIVWTGITLATTVVANAHICWIDHVVLEGSGVRILFAHSANGHSGFVSRRHFTIDNELITWLSPEGSRKTEKGLFLANGESAYVHGTPETVCTIEAAEVDGRLGVMAQGAFAGHSPAKEFIASD